MGEFKKSDGEYDQEVVVGTTENLLPAKVRRSTSDDLLQNYLVEVRRYALLSPEEERELAQTYMDTGDPVIAQKLITSNLLML